MKCIADSEHVDEGYEQHERDRKLTNDFVSEQREREKITKERTAQLGSRRGLEITW